MKRTETERKQQTAITSATGLVSVASALVIVLSLVIILKSLAALLQPFFIALFFFYLGRPLARKLVGYKVPPGLANLAIILVAIAALAVLGTVIGIHIDDLRAKAPAYNEGFRNLLREGLERVAEFNPAWGEQLRKLLYDQLKVGPLAALARALVSTFVGFLTMSLLVVFFLVFMNNEAVTLPDRLDEAYGSRQAARILEVGSRINDGIIRYVYVKAVTSLLVSVLSTIALFGFRIDLALLWGTLFFFGNFVPYIGSFAAVVFPLIIATLQLSSLTSLVILALVLIACQLLVANYVEPLLAGQHLNLSPVVVMLSLAFWGWLWGLIGLILAVPIMMALKLVLGNIPATAEIAILMNQASPKRGDNRRRDSAGRRAGDSRPPQPPDDPDAVTTGDTPDGLP